jgi:hypothetical protein
MDILVQSLLNNAPKLNTAMHIRYSARRRPESASEVARNPLTSPDVVGGGVGMTSYVIIRKEYSYLEPLIRSMFEEAEDVRVLIDRRSSEERRDAQPSSADSERQSTPDRRASAPMLDILINVE